eukprot:1120210-Rhodomonas_salina.3
MVLYGPGEGVRERGGAGGGAQRTEASGSLRIARTGAASARGWATIGSLASVCTPNSLLGGFGGSIGG